MFGYVAPLKSELLVRELTLYQAWYCGLCKTLRREYGQLPRMALSYDCAFLALLLSGTESAAYPCEPQKCGYKPFRLAKPMAPANNALSYAADVNVLLYYYKLQDDWRDERKPIALLGKWALCGAAFRAAKKQPELSVAIREGIEALSIMERAEEASIDIVAEAFARILQNVATGYPGLGEKQKEALSWLGYHLGRWIYLMDAWEDREKDEKRHGYNPFLVNKVQKERASFLLYASLNEMEKAYDLLLIDNHRGLLDNILYQGCRHRCRLVLEGANG